MTRIFSLILAAGGIAAFIYELGHVHNTSNHIDELSDKIDRSISETGSPYLTSDEIERIRKELDEGMEQVRNAQRIRVPYFGAQTDALKAEIQRLKDDNMALYKRLEDAKREG